MTAYFSAAVKEAKKYSRSHQVIAAVGILYVSLVTFSLQFEAVKPGLDESWAWALNALTQTNYIFGRDVVFTFGPLGFLMYPRPIAHNFQWASSFAVGIQVIYGALLCAIAARARTRRGFLLFLATSAVASAFGLWGEYSYRILMGLCLLVAMLDSPFAIPACILAGVLAPVFLLMKFSIGITCLSMMTVLTLILIVREKAWRKIFLLWSTAGLTLAYWVYHSFGSAGVFARWLALSWEVASGYGAAMSYAGPPTEAAIGISLLAALLLATFALKGIARTPFLLFAIPALIALKHGFVGNTGMATGYFVFMFAAAGVAFLFVETPFEWGIASLFWALTLAAAIFKGVFMIAWPPITLVELGRHLSGQTALQGCRNAWNAKRLTSEFRASSTNLLAQEQLSARWVGALSSPGSGVDVFPWELTYLPANDLPWRPSLLLQHYCAFTHSLDQAMADRLGSQSGPSALLMDFIGLAGRHMLIDTPLTFRRILAGYEPVETDYAHSLLWVRRRAHQSAAPGIVISSTRVRFDEWVTVPESPGKLFAQFFIKPNVFGFTRQILWKTSPVYIRLEYENGDSAEYRMLPATASGGVLINYLPRTLQDLADLLAGYAFNKVRRFQLFGPGASSFQQSFEVKWISDDAPFVDYSRLQNQSVPEVVSVNPASSDKQAGMMTVSARDTGGYRRLQLVQIIANEANSLDGACYLRYGIANRVLYLMNGSDRSTGAASLGSQQVLENAKCTVNLAESWPEFRGDTLTLHLDVALKPEIRATQRIFARAIDENGIASEITEFGSWKPASGQLLNNPWKFPPTPPSLSVESEKVAGQDKYIVKVRASDLNGAEDIDGIEVIVNNVVDGRNSCYLRYDKKANAVMLINDSGTASSGPIEPGSSKQVSNAYCAIAALDSPRVTGPYEVYFSFELALTERMLNKRTIYLSAVDHEGLRQSWRAYALLPTEIRPGL